MYYIILNHRIKGITLYIVYTFLLQLDWDCVRARAHTHTHTHTHKRIQFVSVSLRCVTKKPTISVAYNTKHLLLLSWWLLVQPHPTCFILGLSLEGQRQPGAFSCFCNGRSSILRQVHTLQASAP